MNPQPPWQRPPSDAPPAQPTQAPPAGQPQAPPPAPPAGQPTAPPPGPPQAPPAGGAAPPPAPGGPQPGGGGVYAPPPGGGTPGKSKTPLIIAISALVALVVVVGAIVIVLVGGGEGPGPGGGDGPVTPPLTPTEGPGGNDDPPPEAGDLKSIIPEEAGPFTLTGVEQDTTLIEAGAADAYSATYQDADGVELLHQVAVTGSPEDAEAAVGDASEALAEEGFKSAGEPQAIQNEGGEQTGVLTRLTNGEVDVLVWSNQQLFATAIAPGDKVVEFYEAIRY